MTAITENYVLSPILLLVRITEIFDFLCERPLILRIILVIGE
jgi:hypothetical protein